MNVSDIISACIRAFGHSPRDITAWLSGEFALAVLAKLGEPEEDPNCRLLFTEDVTDRDDLPRHAWVFFDGRHYDAETPEGVKGWRDLPVFRRANQTAE